MNVTMTRSRWVGIWNLMDNWPASDDTKEQRKQLAILDAIEGILEGNPLEQVTLDLSEDQRGRIVALLSRPPVVPIKAKAIRVSWEMREALGFPVPKGDE